jgi:phosphoglucomutase
LKITTHSGWLAARPSGTENIYKLYAESFRDQAPPRCNRERGVRDRKQCPAVCTVILTRTARTRHDHRAC